MDIKAPSSGGFAIQAFPAGTWINSSFVTRQTQAQGRLLLFNFFACARARVDQAFGNECVKRILVQAIAMRLKCNITV
jgi:hypothetical protein